MDSTALDVRVVCLREEAPGVVSCELRGVDGGLPPSPPGAHIDVHLPNGLTRQYSVARSTAASYVIAVKREAASRGGSAYIADALRIGTRLRVGRPRNSFALLPDDGRPVVLIAGGIGITPLVSMAAALDAQGRPWRMLYAVRSDDHVVFAEQLRAWGDRVTVHSSARRGRLAIDDVVRDESGATFYCCGPASMLDAFDAATAGLDPSRVHRERFTAAAGSWTGDSFLVRLARSDRLITVAPDKTIVDALLEAGVDVPYSCQQGICGSCEVSVLEGTPDHRDDVLTTAERQSNRTMMICCSRARTPSLVLDL